MAKMWTGRTSGVTEKVADDFNSSISFDKRLYREDITGSMAHAMMLGAKNIITEEESEKLVVALEEILTDLDSGQLAVDLEAEDIHMFVEQVLTARIGELGKKLHTARSRNDQVALDMRMYLKNEITAIREELKGLVLALVERAEEHKATVMPGYTHLQHAQPVTFGHHLMAYAMMLLRDMSRLADCYARTDVCPIGCCALAGTTYDTDRRFEAEKLGFSEIALNSLDGVSDRDFVVEFISCASLIMTHLSRLSEEIILWSSWEFGFIELSDAFTTGSSIMPQKKNSDMAELVRGKTGRVFGDLMGALTVLKGLPLAYNKDMQEDKEGLFDAIDTVHKCLSVFTPMIETMKVNVEKMRESAKAGFMNATDLADYLVKKGLPFRTAYKISGQIVSACIERGLDLESFPLDDYASYSELFSEDVYEAISLDICVNNRSSEGGTSVASVEKQIEAVRGILENV